MGKRFFERYFKKMRLAPREMPAIGLCKKGLLRL